jgi:polyferredoxin
MICSNVSFAAKTVNEVVTQEMTIEQLAAVNDISLEKLLKDLKIADTPENRALSLASLSISNEKAQQVIRKALVLKTEEKSKDWKKIVLKFILWWITVILGIFLLVNGRVTSRFRTWQVFFSFIIFGVWLGSDPSPMGTVKDTIVLVGAMGVVFPPRVVGFLLFMLMAIVGNRLICGWGCQFGSLQDWLYRISPVQTKIRCSFFVSNFVRIAFFLVFVGAAFIIPLDLIGVIDPFKVFAPSQITYLAGAFIAFLLIASLFVYRPWCTFACPFGLVSWYFERLSWFRVRWQENRCVLCGTCQSVCPSWHAAGLLNKAKNPGDCYSCGECLGKCPAKALRYSRKPHSPSGGCSVKTGLKTLEK